jgi:hypothetical protein
METDEEYLEAPLGEVGLAAAEILSICLGHGNSNITKSLSTWVSSLNDRPTNQDLQLGIDAVDRILGTQSEIAETWAESTEGHTWRSNAESLRSRLAMTAERDLFVRFEGLSPDLSQLYRVDWVAYFPTQSDALGAADVFRSDRLDVDLSASDTEPGWSVTASRTGRISYMLVMRMTNRIGQIVEVNRGRLDGWEIAL